MLNKMRFLTATMTMTAMRVNPFLKALAAEGSDEEKLTKQEWEQKRQTELASKSHAELISKSAQLEWDLKKAREKVPKEDQVVLSKADFDELEGYRKYGKPDELKSKLEQGQKDTEELSKLRKKDSLSTAARETGWNVDAVTYLDQVAGGLNLEFKEETKDGKTVKTVLHKGADGKTTPLKDFVEQHHKALLPSLTAASGGAGDDKKEKKKTLGGAGQSTGGDKTDLKSQKKQSGLYRM